MSTLFCRHNRFTADCRICSKGTVLDESSSARGAADRPSTRRGGGKGSRASSTAAAGGRRFAGPYVEAGPYEADGESYGVRLERVLGGVRLGEWGRGELRRRAPVLPPDDLRALVVEAAQRGILSALDTDRLVAAVGAECRAEGAEGQPSCGVSRGRAGDLQDELRVEPAEDGSVRVARWMLRPGRGWVRHDAAPMLPAARYAEALSGAVAVGLIASGSRPERPLPG